MIHPYRRDPNSGSQVLMERLVMKGTPMAEISNMMLESMIGPINALGQDSSGIGYSVYYYATAIAPSPALRLVPVQGTAPSAAAIAQGTYPLTTEVYAVTRRWTSRQAPAVILRDWLLTAEGQSVVRESGYAPLR
jgi:phosphate transport system substrate-binding protein